MSESVLTEDDIDVLDTYLMSDQSPEDVMQLSDLDGFLTGIAVGPTTGTPSEWLPTVWGEEYPQFANEKETQRIIGIILMRYNEILASLAEGPKHFSPIMITGPKDNVIRGDWAEGFLDAVDLNEEAWKPISQNTETSSMLLAILSLCSDGKEEPFSSGDPASFMRFQQDSADKLPWIIDQIYAFWRKRKTR